MPMLGVLGLALCLGSACGERTLRAELDGVRVPGVREGDEGGDDDGDPARLAVSQLVSNRLDSAFAS